MRHLIIISALVFIAASCATEDRKTAQASNKFDTLPLPLDSSSYYFKIKSSLKDSVSDALDTFVNSWYSKMLYALKEPVLKDYKGDKEIYRFTWLRTFNHPVSVRLEKQGSIIKILSKVCDGAGGYEPGKIIFDTIINLTQRQLDTTNIKLDNAKFWSLPTESRDDTGKDGSEWIIEVYKNNKYHIVVRWTPEKGTVFRTIDEYLILISKVRIERTGRDNGDY